MVNQGETRWDENEGGLGKKRVEREEWRILINNVILLKEKEKWKGKTIGKSEHWM
jgi:hypothetical protein